MTSTTFAVGHRTTHGFRLILAVVTAAMVGFVVEVTRPVAAHQQPAPQPAAVSLPLASNS